MALSKEHIAEVISKYGKTTNDSGSAEVQVVLMSNQINMLNEHLQTHKKDHAARRALMILVGKRRGLLDYLKRTNVKTYEILLADLKLRK